MATLPEGSNPATMARPVRFAELHCKSNFSFLQGASHPEELVHQAHVLGYEALALTDECSLTGIVKAHVAAQEFGVHLIVGAEFRLNCPIADEVTVVLLAPTQKAYEQLSSLITFARRRCPKGEYELHCSELPERVSECLALWPPDRLALSQLLEQGSLLSQCVPKLWLALELFRMDDDAEHTSTVLALASRLKLPVVASNDVHMHIPERKPLLDTVAAIRLHKTVDTLGTAAFSNSERHLRPLDALADLYLESMLVESVKIARQCTFSMTSLHYEYPEELVPVGLTPGQHLRNLTFAGAQERYPAGIPSEVQDLLDKELQLIEELQYEYYFLTVYDIVRFAREQEILCQGRGSAANSATCYCLHITEVDPDRIHLLFERFVSKERHEPPDIDVDFEHERREEVIQYIYSTYTRERAALAATLITYRPRSAIRDVGKALGLGSDLLDLLAKSMSWWDRQEVLNERLREVGVNPDSLIVQLFCALVREILGFPRHLSQHVGGFVIAARPISNLVPIENAAMDDRTVIQWDKEDLESMNLLKVDVLGLGMLTAIRKAMALVNEFRDWHGTDALCMSNIPAEEPETYAMLQAGDSIGVFQVESRAQISMLPRLKPKCFYDLVIEVAIVRPGPIQGNMVHPFLKRRQGIEPITYSNDAVRKVLERTLGVPIFQEQVIELAMVAAGFTAGEADQLRRAIAGWRRRGGLENFQEKLVKGMLERGHSQEFANRIVNQIKGFGEYGFPESHAASFALLVYVSAWLKRHEPAAFYCGLLNSLPMGFYSPAQLVQDAQRHDIEIRAVDVQVSGWDYRLEHTSKSIPQYQRQQGAVRVGLRQIKGLHEEAAQRVVEGQPYVDIDDLAQRAQLNDQDLTFLARAGALKSLSGERYQAHWDAAGVDRPITLVESANLITKYFTEVRRPDPTEGENTVSDYQYLGLTLGAHPVALLRSDAEFKRCVRNCELTSIRRGQIVEVVGLITCRQRPGSGAGVVFLTLEDETGNSNVVVWSTLLERFRASILQSQLVRVKGTLDKEGEVVHIILGFVEDMTHKLATISSRERKQTKIVRSRDFH